MNDRSGVPGSREGPARGLAGRVVDAVVAPLVRPVVDAVDVREVVGRIDVDDVVGRIDVAEVVGRIDVDELLDRIDVDALLERIDVERVVSRIDVDALVGRVDVDALVGRVDVEALLGRIDVNGLLDRIDMDELLDRIDPDRLLQRVDVDRLVGRMDVNALMDRVDVNGLVSRTNLGEVIARSTTGVFGQLLDAVRIGVMSLDLALHGITARLLRRDNPGTQFAPDGTEDRTPMGQLSPQDRAVALQGRYAGAVSRFLAFLIDATISGALYGLIGALMLSALRIVVNVTWMPADHRLLVSVAYALWQFIYFAGLTATTGRTIGKAVLGILVVQRDGTRVTAAGASLRTVAFPLSFLLLGAGFLLGIVRRDRRQLQDLIGGTAVVYTWDAETARLRSEQPTSAPT